MRVNLDDWMEDVVASAAAHIRLEQWTSSAASNGRDLGKRLRFADWHTAALLGQRRRSGGIVAAHVPPFDTVEEGERP